jgi:hypothetical protein
MGENAHLLAEHIAKTKTNTYTELPLIVTIDHQRPEHN